MDKVFEPGENELVESQGDTSQIVAIQNKVKELLEANIQRKQGLKQEIIEQGAWSLPGLLNATLVWMNKLEDDRQSQEILANIIAQIAKNNPAAEDHIFRTGALSSFSVPSSIARTALEQLHWKPREKDFGKLRREIDRCLKISDIQTVLNLYSLLLRAGLEEDFNNALDLCKKWVAQDYSEQSGKLLSLLTHLFPGRVLKVLSEVILEVKKYRDENIAKAFLGPLRPIPTNWVKENIILDISLDVFEQISTIRHTTIESIWTYALQDFYDELPELWGESLDEIGEQIRQKGTESIYRYWFKGVGKNGGISYISKQAKVFDEKWANSAMLQLFFLKRSDQQANQELEDLEIAYPERYHDVETLFDLMRGSTKDKGKTKTIKGPSLLTDS